MAKLWTLAKWALGIAVAVALSYGLFIWTTSNGRKAVVELARERQWCTTPECTEGATLVYLVTKDATGWSETKTDWCLGVDDWSAAKVYRGGWLKSIAVDLMYWPCDLPQAEQEPFKLPAS